MPIYQFRCDDTGQEFEVQFNSISEYDPASVRSPFTQSPNVTRIIREVNLARGGRLEALMRGDEDSLHALEDADPASLGHALREMAAETGEDMGNEFHEIVDRLSAGQAPEEIEAALPPIEHDD
ncbi:MAG: hypothetical protein HC915_07225 [Anaerolineae bacterium]|nr:hypothetical protein [Anaerolineae bacterium]